MWYWKDTGILEKYTYMLTVQMIRELIKHRFLSFSSGNWEGPESSSVVDPFIVIDLDCNSGIGGEDQWDISLHSRYAPSIPYTDENGIKWGKIVKAKNGHGIDCAVMSKTGELKAWIRFYKCLRLAYDGGDIYKNYRRVKEKRIKMAWDKYYETFRNNIRESRESILDKSLDDLEDEMLNRFLKMANIEIDLIEEYNQIPKKEI